MNLRSKEVELGTGAGGGSAVLECLPNMHGALGLTPSTARKQLACCVYLCIYSSRVVEVGGTEIQSHSQTCTKFEASLGCMKPCLKRGWRLDGAMAQQLSALATAPPEDLGSIPGIHTTAHSVYNYSFRGPNVL